MNPSAKSVAIKVFIFLNLTLCVFYFFTSVFTTWKTKFTSYTQFDPPEIQAIKKKLIESEFKRKDAEQVLEKLNHLHRLTIVTIDTPKQHNHVRRLVGSIRKQHSELTI